MSTEHLGFAFIRFNRERKSLGFSFYVVGLERSSLGFAFFVRDIRRESLGFAFFVRNIQRVSVGVSFYVVKPSTNTRRTLGFSFFVDDGCTGVSGPDCPVRFIRVGGKVFLRRGYLTFTGFIKEDFVMAYCTHVGYVLPDQTCYLGITFQVGEARPDSLGYLRLTGVVKDDTYDSYDITQVKIVSLKL